MSHRLNDPKYRVGYWKMNNNALDYSGHGNDGTWGGTEAYREGPFGNQAGDFNNVSHVAFGEGSGLWDMGTGSVTLSAWFQWDGSGAYDGLIAKKRSQSVAQVGYLMQIESSNKVRGWISDGTLADNVISTTLVNDGMYHHAVFSSSTTDVYLYLDGILEQHNPRTAVSSDNNEDMVIGTRSDLANFMDGCIFNAAVYNIALTGDEVKKLYLMEQR